MDTFPDEIIVMIYQHLLSSINHNLCLVDDKSIKHTYSTYVSKYYSFDALSMTCKTLHRCSKDIEILKIINQIKLWFINVVHIQRFGENTNRFNKCAWYLYNIVKPLINHKDEMIQKHTIKIFNGLITLDRTILLKIIPATFDPNERKDISDTIWKLAEKKNKTLTIYLRFTETLLIGENWEHKNLAPLEILSYFPIERQIKQLIYTLDPDILVKVGIVYNAIITMYMYAHSVTKPYRVNRMICIMIDMIHTAIRRYFRLNGVGSNKTLINILESYKVNDKIDGKFTINAAVIGIFDRLHGPIQNIYKKYIKLPIRYRNP